ncbi:patatin-like phospholipase family protein [Candidatus Binatus soli]|jgi:NTE family protein|uniref:patatin-like phospholipase family protein n=1 Tax=Candidatus Binatus soli TaxID=1953413 RepID=UPI003D0D4A18
MSSQLNDTQQLGAATGSLRERIAALELFEDLDEHEIDALAAEMLWIGLPAGSVLFVEGELGDALYIVLSGRLSVLATDAHGDVMTVAQITPGETVGEMALLSGDPRAATVAALRDAELVGLKRDAFERLVDRHPRILSFVTRLLVKRLRETSHGRRSLPLARTLALVPLGPGPLAGDFTRQLAAAFKGLGVRAFVADGSSSDRGSEWFTSVEEAHDLLLYQADPAASQWTSLCMRQADRVILVADAVCSPPTELQIAGLVPRRISPEMVDLVVVHASQGRAVFQVEQMLQCLRAGFPIHVREGNADDFARLARLVSGRSMGIVFSGGGARGFAHIGVLRAFRAAGIPLDLFGGTSMGAIIAAAAALEWDEPQMIAHLRRALVDTNPLNDYTLPLFALIRGRKLSRSLRELFGDALIEECWHSFYCTSTNLTTGLEVTHRFGPLWRALRASASLPGVLTPVVTADGHFLADGAVLNNLPVDVMSTMHRGLVVGVDVGQDHPLKSHFDDLEEQTLWRLLRAQRGGAPNIISLLMRAGTVSSDALLRHQRTHADLIINPRLPEVGMLEWKVYSRIIEEGYRQTMEALERSLTGVRKASITASITAFADFKKPLQVICPADGEAAQVTVDAAHAAMSVAVGANRLRVNGCSRWPGRDACDRICLS